jgi:AAA15 family ATPase/GTPase
MKKNIRKVNLISAKFSNHFSFDKEQKIFFTQDTKYSTIDDKWNLIKQGKNKILPVTIFYGANASGKSNLMLLFHQLKDFLKNSKKVSSKLRGYHPFALNDENKEKSSLLEFEFLLDEDIVCYSLLFNSSAILSERLYLNKKTLYQKNKNKISFNDKKLSEYVINEVQDTIKRKKDVLVLELLAIKECEPYVSIYDVFDNSFMSFESMRSNKDLLEELYNRKERWDKISKWLQSADLGVSHFEIEKRETPPEKKKLEKLVFEKLQSIPQFQVLENVFESMPENSYEYRLQFYHTGENGKEYPLPSGVESDGTMAFFNILVRLYPAFLNGGLFFADEIDSSLHPLLVKVLIQAFNNPRINKGGAQLICTTHNSNLLKKDVLRRDEVWFIEKDATGHSSVYPLSQFTNIRNNVDFEKWYLQGRFGGIPLGINIKDFEKLMEE